MIVLVAPEHEDVLRGQFGRYEREYEIRCTRSAAQTAQLLREARAEGVPVPLLVTESQLPDSEMFPAFAEWRSIIPTARRIVAAFTKERVADAHPALLRPVPSATPPRMLGQ